MIGSLIGCVTVCVGTAYAYKNSPCVKRELDAASDWIDRQIDWIFGSSDDKPKSTAKPKAKGKSKPKTKATAKSKAKPKAKPKTKVEPKSNG